MLIADDGRLLRRPFLDLRRVVASGGLRGLLSLAFHPRYVDNGRAYVNYVGRDGAVYVAEIRTVDGFAAARRVLLRIPASRDPYAHFGGHVAFGPDGMLYVGIGDGGDPETAQDPTTLLGKIVRLRAQRATPAPQIVAWGLRNPWRFSYTRDGSALVIGDVGADHREEIDVVPRRLLGRADLGWPTFEGTVRRVRTSRSQRRPRPALRRVPARAGPVQLDRRGLRVPGVALPASSRSLPLRRPVRRHVERPSHRPGRPSCPGGAVRRGGNPDEHRRERRSRAAPRERRRQSRLAGAALRGHASSGCRTWSRASR